MVLLVQIVTCSWSVVILTRMSLFSNPLTDGCADLCMLYLFQFRERAVTLPRPNRLNDYAGRGGGQSNIGVSITDHTGGVGGQEQAQRQQYTKQISSPEMSHQSQVSSNFHGHVPPSSSGSPSFTGSPSNDFRYHHQFSHPGRQRSEYENFQTELSVSGTENILRIQSERFANYESEAMKKKEPPR